jgi:hypothetical protein
MPPSAVNIGAPSRTKRKPPPPVHPTACDTPPCSPAITFSSRGTQCVAACSPISMPIQRRPILWATAAVVPLPRKESNTMSVGFELDLEDAMQQLFRFGRRKWFNSGMSFRR